MRTAVGIAGAAADDPGTGLRAVAALRDLTERLEILQVDNARQLGWSWPEIATMLGANQHSVHHKHHKHGRDGRRGQRTERR